MTAVARLFLGTALFVVLSGAAMAEDLAPVQGAPAVSPAAPSADIVAPTTAPATVTQEDAAKTEEVVAVPAAAPSATEICDEAGGLAGEPSDALSLFYKSQPTSISHDGDVLKIAEAQGAMVVNGITYQLHSIEIPKAPANTTDYKLEIQFIHAAEDGSTAVLSVPVQVEDNAPNLGMEKLLSLPETASVDPNDFLPESRAYTPAGSTFGADCSPKETVQHFVMVHPVDISSAQYQKFENLFKQSL